MRMYDLIVKKRNGGTLTSEEIHWFVQGYVADEIPDYQVSALLMAIYFQGMNDAETTALTLAMAHSGDMVDLRDMEGFHVDKHSTGGVGDKTSLILGPIVASLGVKVAKMSGRGLGHTGGTLDKLESIEGFQIQLSRERFAETVNRVGIAIIGQSGNLVPADKKLYALRDVTGTVDSLPLIASSIMSKKLAAGSEGIVLDVKTGSGAFMKTLEDSIALAQKMVDIGTRAGRKMAALVTDMDVPLGYAIGNALEVKEVIDTLQGRGPEDLTEVCLQLAAQMLSLSGMGDASFCYEKAKQTLGNGSAFEKFSEMVEAQGGNTAWLRNPSLFPVGACEGVLTASTSGYVTAMDAEGCGLAASLLGAGRLKKEDAIDYSAGIVLQKKTGDFVEAGEVMARLWARDTVSLEQGIRRLQEAYEIGANRPEKHPLIYKTLCCNSASNRV